MGKKKVITKSGGEGAQAKAGAVSLKKGKKLLDAGRVYINASYNNTSVTVTDTTGAVIAWSTAGSLGFSGPKKATPFAASKVIAVIAEKVSKTGLVNVDVYISGVGSGRDSAIRSLINHGFQVLSVHDVTPIPHNGPKPKKARKI
jgi:small subunit ribosomal protein S11